MTVQSSATADDSDNQAALISPFQPPLPAGRQERHQWGRLYGLGKALALQSLTRQHHASLLIITANVREAQRLADEIGFFAGDAERALMFPDWETLPYDHFSPLPELISQRLRILARLQQHSIPLLIAPISVLLQRLAPRSWLAGNSLEIAQGDRLPLESLRQRLIAAGYQHVPQVLEHGEFAVRGSIIDLFPMGAVEPYRIDLFDEEVDSIRTFDPESQRSRQVIPAIRLLAAHEFPIDDEGINRFRQGFRNQFAVDPNGSPLYREVSKGNLPGGIEYYLPLFHEHTETLFDYLPADTLIVETEQVVDAARRYLAQVDERFEQLRYNSERPLLAPAQLYLSVDELNQCGKPYRRIALGDAELVERRKGYAEFFNFAGHGLPPLTLNTRASDPAAALRQFIAKLQGRLLFVAESAGRREVLLGTLKDLGWQARTVSGWREFIDGKMPLAVCVAPVENPLHLPYPAIAVVTESQLFGEQVRQTRRRKSASRDSGQLVRNLTELDIGAPVVHETHGVGRYLGLQTLTTGQLQGEFLTIEYARGDKLYVPVSSLHLISRYTGTSPDQAPWHRLGGDQWQKIKSKAAQKVRDVAAELLDVHARRAAREGFAFPAMDSDYQAFSAAFEFETTVDQQQAIDAVLADMGEPRPMDRVVCGDVGFGKTEVAMRAAFQAVQGGKQVAVLVPTTLLSQQHFDNFSDRFADWPVRIDSLSRFKSGKQQQQALAKLLSGETDIVIGTHKLLSRDIRFKNLGLVIVDEEHRFGVRHKEQLKALRNEVDLLTLTATPIPRTLNMALSGIRDLSIIATPPAERHPIKTFVSEWQDSLIGEACQRELKRGGQVYFLHNEVRTIETQAARLQQLLPDARVQIAHGQMRERDLERIIRDFYHQRFNILVSTTIIESGIDIPSANTIIINRADKLGLAQLHQLRGRVGRSHHRAYAYLITPPPASLTADARKRLQAIESLEDLGAGFSLATHDLEIRGAGELLGDEQSGQIQEIGFTLYMDLLERAVDALKSGRTPDLERSGRRITEVDLQVPALLPDDYIPDVHNRLVLYKRIASAEDQEQLKDLEVELIDRFGLLPEPAKNLFLVTEIKLRAAPLGIQKVEAGAQSGRLLFDAQPDIDPGKLIRLLQGHPKAYRLDGNSKLRFFAEMPDLDARRQRINAIIDALC